MLSTIPHFILIFLLFSPVWGLSQGDNTLHGTISMPGKKDSRVKIYQDYENRVNAGELEEMILPDRNVFVSLHPLSFTPELSPSANVYITQKEEAFLPKVVAVTKGSTVYILNEDNQYHNVYSRTPRASFNIGRRPPGHSHPQKVKKTGIVRLFCDIHEHMKGFILSFETPYFSRVDKHGQYTLKNLPDGTYRMEVFHPDGTKRIQELSLEGGEVRTENVDLSKDS